ncbi:MAG: tRNA pseudouridine(55) synthase TruB [Alloprevotella sp.]|nr:tRNA pseudouridine(55) synthase TruB [Prevotella sp.]MBR1712759.1 tRNA pseudouridine(55) synthase TruB [Alloprevotella sp.]
MNFLKGQVLAFDKPYRATSFRMVAHVRRLLTKRIGRRLKVGHAGTLDPLATGVLVICTGRATKTIEALQGHTKEYVAELCLGATTPSYDLEHPVDAVYPTAHITDALVRETLHRFEGDTDQVPPIFSACHADGKRAYELARKGKDVELKPKRIHIDSIVLEELRLPDYARIRVTCGKGTYIRALARDIGEALGSGAHLTSLRRTRVGDIRVEDCFTEEGFEAWLSQQTIENDLD